MRNPGNILELSTISLAEIAIKAGLGKLNLSADLVRQAISDLDARILPYTAEHALRLFSLPHHHSDRFDRQIAQALSENLAVVTPDERFALHKGLTAVW